MKRSKIISVLKKFNQIIDKKHYNQRRICVFGNLIIIFRSDYSELNRLGKQIFKFELCIANVKIQIIYIFFSHFFGFI